MLGCVLSACCLRVVCAMFVYYQNVVHMMVDGCVCLASALSVHSPHVVRVLVDGCLRVDCLMSTCCLPRVRIVRVMLDAFLCVIGALAA